MAVSFRYLTGTADLDEHWAGIWPLLDALDHHHAALTGKQLRDEREERTYAKISRGLQQELYWFQIAEEDDEVVGTASAQVQERGVLSASPVGYTSDLYLKPNLRGLGLSRAMRQARHETLRSCGMTVTESSILASNRLGLQASDGDLWGASWSLQKNL